MENTAQKYVKNAGFPNAGDKNQDAGRIPARRFRERYADGCADGCADGWNRGKRSRRLSAAYRKAIPRPDDARSQDCFVFGSYGDAFFNPSQRGGVFADAVRAGQLINFLSVVVFHFLPRDLVQVDRTPCIEDIGEDKGYEK